MPALRKSLLVAFTALALPAAERLRRWRAQHAYVRRFTAAHWSENFLAALSKQQPQVI